MARPGEEAPVGQALGDEDELATGPVRCVTDLPYT
jgi:hypothetical protein